ncbi:MAG: transporter substrate-binding domain-containing protein [Spirochaetaceae bacterium]|jgi:L-cystine transport system substrate-binding protein|nr:transporter substrate-binding domain-containing protein [Spirochaetaceae bacterium]
MKKKVVSLGTLILLILALLAMTACKGRVPQNSSEVKTVIAGVYGAYPPFNYTDSNNELIGYELEILKEVDKRLPQYVFEYQKLSGDVLLTSVDAGRVDIGVCQWEFNVDRAEKYYFTEGYNSYDLYVTVLENNDTIKDMTDLDGKVLGIRLGGNSYNVATRYIAAHPELNISLFNLPLDESLTIPNFLNRTYDAILANPFNVVASNFSNTAKLKYVGEAVSSSEAHFLLKKTRIEDDIETLKLLNAIDTAILAMKVDGTLALLYEQEVTSYLKNLSIGS